MGLLLVLLPCRLSSKRLWRRIDPLVTVVDEGAGQARARDWRRRLAPRNAGSGGPASRKLPISARVAEMARAMRPGGRRRPCRSDSGVPDPPRYAASHTGQAHGTVCRPGLRTGVMPIRRGERMRRWPPGPARICGAPRQVKRRLRPPVMDTRRAHFRVRPAEGRTAGIESKIRAIIVATTLSFPSTGDRWRYRVGGRRGMTPGRDLPPRGWHRLRGGPRAGGRGPGRGKAGTGRDH